MGMSEAEANPSGELLARREVLNSGSKNDCRKSKFRQQCKSLQAVPKKRNKKSEL